MKKCIHICEGLYLSLELITAFDFTDGSQILIYSGDAEDPVIIEYDAEYSNGKTIGSFKYVKIQEFQRIKCEICQFFEINEPKSED